MLIFGFRLLEGPQDQRVIGEIALQIASISLTIARRQWQELRASEPSPDQLTL